MKFMGALLLCLAIVPLSGCPSSAITQNLKTCELNALPQALQSAAAELLSVVLNPGSAVSDVEDLGKNLAPGQLSCLGQALLAWLSGQPNSTTTDPHPPVAQALMEAHQSVTRDHAVSVLKQYLAAHPGDSPKAARARAIALLKSYLDKYPAMCLNLADSRDRVYYLYAFPQYQQSWADYDWKAYYATTSIVNVPSSAFFSVQSAPDVR